MNKHIFTVDVENWYDGLPKSNDLGARFNSRLEFNVRYLLSILQEKNISATFFWLGSLAEKNKGLIREVQNMGHDIGCHGWTHTHIQVLGNRGFLDETQRALGTIADIIGKPVIHYRAPYFSISEQTPWALPALVRNGIKFDSSIVPVKYWRYGFPGFDPTVSVHQTDHGEITEIPVSTGNFLGIRIPFGGGAWFRMIPFSFVKRGYQHLEELGITGVFYIHPWELDPGHPNVFLNPKYGITHYCKLGRCEKKLRILLDQFRFTSIDQFFPASSGSREFDRFK